MTNRDRGTIRTAWDGARETFTRMQQDPSVRQQVLFRSAFTLTVTSGMSYVLGFVRDRLLAQQFGASAELDVYYSAFLLSDTIVALFVASVVAAAFIPLFAEVYEQGVVQMRLYTQVIMLYAVGSIAIAATICYVFLPQIATVLVPGFDDAQSALYVTTARTLLLSALLFAVSTVLGGVLIVRRQLLYYGLSAPLYNLGIIVAVAVFAEHYGITAAVWGVIAGAVLHMVIRLCASYRVLALRVQRGYTVEVCKLLRRTAVLTMPKVGQIVLAQGLLLWYTRLATTAVDGGVVVYNLARNFQSMPVSLLGIALATSAYGALSVAAAKNDQKAFATRVQYSARVVLTLTTLSALVLAAVSHVMISVLFGGGAFDAEAIQMTAAMLAVYAACVPLESMMHLLARVHYALQQSRVVFLAQCGSVGIIALLSVLSFPMIGLFAIPVSFLGGLLVQNAVLWITYKKSKNAFF